jgi:DNA-binding HxlR family transcriptional regulator
LTHGTRDQGNSDDPNNISAIDHNALVRIRLRILEGRWKLVILFHLFGGNVRRFSELRRAIPAVSEKMLIQQLRQMERDGIVRRFVHHQVPPKVEYSLSDWGQALCPALDALLKWVDLRASLAGRELPLA